MWPARSWCACSGSSSSTSSWSTASTAYSSSRPWGRCGSMRSRSAARAGGGSFGRASLRRSASWSLPTTRRARSGKASWLCSRTATRRWRWSSSTTGRATGPWPCSWRSLPWSRSTRSSGAGWPPGRCGLSIAPGSINIWSSSRRRTGERPTPSTPPSTSPPRSWSVPSTPTHYWSRTRSSAW